MVSDDDWSVDDMPGSYSPDDVRDWTENVETVLEYGVTGDDSELEEVYDRIKTHYMAHDELARDGEYAEAFYELEAAADLVDTWDIVDASLEKDGYFEDGDDF